MTGLKVFSLVVLLCVTAAAAESPDNETVTKLDKSSSNETKPAELPNKEVQSVKIKADSQTKPSESNSSSSEPNLLSKEEKLSLSEPKPPKNDTKSPSPSKKPRQKPQKFKPSSKKSKKGRKTRPRSGSLTGPQIPTAESDRPGYSPKALKFFSMLTQLFSTKPKAKLGPFGPKTQAPNRPEPHPYEFIIPPAELPPSPRRSEFSFDKSDNLFERPIGRPLVSPRKPSFLPPEPSFGSHPTSFPPNGPPFGGHRPSFPPNGPPFGGHRPPFPPNGPPFGRHRPSFPPNGPSFGRHQPSFPPNGPSFLPQKPSFFPNRPYFPPNGPTFAPNRSPFLSNQSPLSPNEPLFAPNRPQFLPHRPLFSSNRSFFTPHGPLLSSNRPPFPPNRPPFPPNRPPFPPNRPVFSPNGPSFEKNNPTPLNAPPPSTSIFPTKRSQFPLDSATFLPHTQPFLSNRPHSQPFNPIFNAKKQQSSQFLPSKVPIHPSLINTHEIISDKSELYSKHSPKKPQKLKFFLPNTPIHPSPILPLKSSFPSSEPAQPSDKPAPPSDGPQIPPDTPKLSINTPSDLLKRPIDISKGNFHYFPLLSIRADETETNSTAPTTLTTLLKLKNQCTRYFLEKLNFIEDKLANNSDYSYSALVNSVTRNLRRNIADVLQYYSLLVYPVNSTTDEFTGVEIVDLIHVLRGLNDLSITPTALQSKLQSIELTIPPCPQRSEIISNLNGWNPYRRNIIDNVLREIFVQKFTDQRTINEVLLGFRFSSYGPDLYSKIFEVSEKLKLKNPQIEIPSSTEDPKNPALRLTILLDLAIKKNALDLSTVKNVFYLIRSLKSGLVYFPAKSVDVRETLNIIRSPDFPKDVWRSAIRIKKYLSDPSLKVFIRKPTSGFTRLENALSVVESVKNENIPKLSCHIKAVYTFLKMRYLQTVGMYKKPTEFSDIDMIFDSFRNVRRASNPTFIDIIMKILKNPKYKLLELLKKFSFSDYTSPRCLSQGILKMLIELPEIPEMEKELLRMFLEANYRYIRPCRLTNRWWGRPVPFKGRENMKD